MSLHGFGDSQIVMAVVPQNVSLTDQLFESWLFQVTKESYEKIGVQGGSAPKNQLVDVTLYKVCHQNHHQGGRIWRNSSYTSLLYQVVDGNSEPKKFFSRKIPLTHGLIVIEEGGEEQGLLVSGHFKFLNGLKNISWS